MIFLKKKFLFVCSSLSEDSFIVRGTNVRRQDRYLDLGVEKGLKMFSIKKV